MKLSQLVMNDMYLPLEWDREFDHISTDSRTIKKGDLFVALPGVKEHGEKFIHAALANGAVAVLVAGIWRFAVKRANTTQAFRCFMHRKLANTLQVGCAIATAFTVCTCLP